MTETKYQINYKNKIQNFQTSNFIDFGYLFYLKFV